MTALIAEDGIFNQEVLQLLLEVLNVESIVANNGKEALDIVKSAQKIDLIFMDINMPIMDGESATIEIRKYEKEFKLQRIPIIAASASVDEKYAAKLLSIGMDGVISKPIMSEELQSIVEKHSTQGGSYVYDAQKAAQTLRIPQELMEELLKKFVATLDNELTTMLRLAHEKDYVTLRQIAHRLKGSAGNLKITPMYESFVEIEQSAKLNENVDYDNLIAKISNVNKDLKKF